MHENWMRYVDALQSMALKKGIDFGKNIADEPKCEREMPYDDRHLQISTIFASYFALAVSIVGLYFYFTLVPSFRLGQIGHSFLFRLRNDRNV